MSFFHKIPSWKRILVLVDKEIRHTSKSFFFIFAVVGPVTFTLLVNLVFGSIFSGQPKLGIVDKGNSQLVKSLSKVESINLQKFQSEIELKDAVAEGARDIGIIFPERFDTKIEKKEAIKLKTYTWGESLLKNRAIVQSTILYKVREIAGEKAPIEIELIPLGDKENIPWKDRFLPVIILMAIFISGFAIPSSSLVEEKQKGTIQAVLTTPITQTEIFAAKGIMGFLVSLFMGITILILNNAFNEQLSLIILILSFGSIMACCFGLIIGAFMNEIATLYSAIKGLGIFIYGPGIVVMFPQIPQWVAKLFPTYYVINPIFEISRKGGSWTVVKLDIFILIGILTFFILIVGGIAKITKQQKA